MPTDLKAWREKARDASTSATCTPMWSNMAGNVAATTDRRQRFPRCRETVGGRTYVRSVHGSAGGLQIDLVWERQVTVPRLPVSWLSDEDKAAELQRVQARRAMDAAYEAELILGLAADRPAGADPAPDPRGARRPGWTPEAASGGVSEFFTAELSTILNLGRGTAATRLARALTWRHKLPATFAALAAGELDERRAGALSDVLAATTAEVAGRVEDALLGQATQLSVYRLTDRAL